MNAATPDPAPGPGAAGLPGHKAVGITLAPGPGRRTALVIALAPLLLYVLVAVLTANGSGSSLIGGGNPHGPSPQAPAQATTSPAPANPLPAGYPSSGTAQSGSAATTLAPTTPATSGSSPPITANDPSATVQMAYVAINGGDYRKAYLLGLAQPGQSYADFVAGYQNTSAVELPVVSVQGGMVTVDLTAIQKDGTEQTYTGTYTASSGHITSADIQQTS